MFIILYILVIGCKVLFYIIHMTAGIGSSGPATLKKRSGCMDGFNFRVWQLWSHSNKFVVKTHLLHFCYRKLTSCTFESVVNFLNNFLVGQRRWSQHVRALTLFQIRSNRWTSCVIQCDVMQISTVLVRSQRTVHLYRTRSLLVAVAPCWALKIFQVKGVLGSFLTFVKDEHQSADGSLLCCFSFCGIILSKR